MCTSLLLNNMNNTFYNIDFVDKNKNHLKNFDEYHLDHIYEMDYSSSLKNL